MPRWRVTTTVLVPVSASVEVVAEDAADAIVAAEGLGSARWSFGDPSPTALHDLEIALDDGAEVRRVDEHGEALDGAGED